MYSVYFKHVYLTVESQVQKFPTFGWTLPISDKSLIFCYPPVFLLEKYSQRIFYHNNSKQPKW